MLRADGWQLDRQVGSHRQFRHPTISGTVTVAGSGKGSQDRHHGEHSPSSWSERRPQVSTYLVIIEGSGDSYSAYVPDLPGCVAAGNTVQEVEELIREAIPLHIESLRAHGEPVPEPEARASSVSVEAAS
ncbi:MAG: type II toxin-antitoxin system HicB family antitoxin [Candidatus Dormibacteraeota bacterium]|uniref:Type II toxin-antitoxin system HicB family antitoxin n=1 Tax=Candidatus Nephthysia bennettiae TaxID=3127016 RepID=A0A934N8I3_9BACT|nr:type II toxin-antitoxin system HicB family antitoxin [Candidatus Dormibacteraeota bacterium]MBJ7612806.1 type II toxin-antitoxin system HicB family antitoxin [Candidatus Dormibacteraeota bacterium]